MILTFDKFVNESYTAVKANNLEDLSKKFAKKYKLSDKEMEAIFYTVHSDEHISPELKNIISKLQKNGEIPKVTLYRGCSDIELESILANKHSNVETLSFSEDINAAKHSGKNIIEIVAKAPMFCYHKFLGDYYTSMKDIDFDEYNAVDGDFMIETAEEESEWICTNDYEFTMTEKENSKYYKFVLNK